ncbi:MAG TPA: hypothetical protein DD381_11920 [Lentisphaeria bacterium]|nr:MAG: hypothetical protein A2X47_02515 [Lentisphaerae bacterium GWF2_38_69]HBM17033.1 hypothetical protein [Lentisphaeria bacterium]
MKLFPENIKKIAIVALAGKPDKERIVSGSDFLKTSGYEVVSAKSLNGKNELSYLSSDIETRVSDIENYWNDPRIDLIIAARGGYGSVQILSYIDWKALSKRQIPFIGYSDMTAFHLAMCANKVGIPISGPMIHNFHSIRDDSFSLLSLKNAFMDKQVIEPESGRKRFEALNSGRAIGKIYPVTLSVLVTLIGTPYLPDLRGSILMLEDINEPVYKLDRYFTQLEQSDILSNISGLILGSFTRCGNARERNKLFINISKRHKFPIVMNIPFGHAYPRISVKYESICSMDVTGNKIVLELDNGRERL